MSSNPSKTRALLPTNDHHLQQIVPHPSNENRESIFAKCEVDPIKAQDDAMISVALKLQKNQLTVNEFTVDEARTTMVRSNYAPDWTRANWNHPLLANLKNLSCLSSFDLPSETKRGLVDEKKAIEYGLSQRGEAANQNRDIAIDASNQNEQETNEQETDEGTQSQQQQREEQNQLPQKQQQRFQIRNEVIEPSALQYAMDHKTPAIVETTPFILRQTALLDLSPETISSDPQLLALVSAIAAANKSDPRVAGKVAMGEIPTIPVVPQVPSIRNTYPVHRRACDALPKPSAVVNGDYNKGFHDSDIVGYGQLQTDLEPEGTKDDDEKKRMRMIEASPSSSNNNNNNVHDENHNAGSVRREPNRSMHDVGYKTWMQKHLEEPSEYEDRERFAEYRDQVTSYQGKCLSVTERQ